MSYTPISPAIAVIKAQITKIPDILDFLIGDVSPDEWMTRLAPNDNMLGFVAWHLPSVQDFTVQSLIRAIPEVRHRAEWQQRATLDTSTFSFGISMHDADAAALNSKPADVLQYAVAVCEEIITWLDTINDDDLFLVPDGPANLSQCTAYQGFEISDEIDGLYARSVHDLLASTCYGHIRSHFGEIETIVKQCRRR
jgi:hypothetical protein